jgi:hypothetical protein
MAADTASGGSTGQEADKTGEMDKGCATAPDPTVRLLLNSNETVGFQTGFLADSGFLLSICHQFYIC